MIRKRCHEVIFVKITVYGDSIFKGVLFEDGHYLVDNSWEALLAEKLGVTIHNRSRFGCTVTKALAAIKRDGERPAEPEEYALMELGGNDCDFDWAAIARAPNRGYESKTPPRAFTEQYREAVRLVRESGRVPVIASLPPIHSEKYLTFLCRDGLSRRNIVYWLGDVEAISRWQAMYSELVEDVARREGVRLLDIRAPFPQAGVELADLLCSDGIHPSHAGQRLIYDTLCAASL